jgi:hypothetical protein
MDQVKSLSFSFCIDISMQAKNILTGNQLRQDLRRWLSPPDPSINHNIACGAHRKQTAEWFFQGSIFAEWKSNGPFLWLHGKRMFSLPFQSRPLIATVATSCSGIRKERTLVRCYQTPSKLALLTSGLARR